MFWPMHKDSLTVAEKSALRPVLNMAVYGTCDTKMGTNDVHQIWGSLISGIFCVIKFWEFW